MPRIAITPTAFTPNGSIADTAGVAVDPANGMVVAKSKPELMVIRVNNSFTSAKNVTIKAGAYPPAIASGQGDLAVSVVNATTRWIGPVESGRFLQANGDLNIDIEAGMTGNITVFTVPRNT